MYQFNPLYDILTEGWKQDLIKHPEMIKRELDPFKRQMLHDLRQRLVMGRKVAKKAHTFAYIPQGPLTKGWKKDSIVIMKPKAAKLMQLGKEAKHGIKTVKNGSKLDRVISSRKPGDLKSWWEADKYWG